MNSGLQTFSVDNQVQVDTNHRTMLLLKSGQFTADDSRSWLNEIADIQGRMTNAGMMCVNAPNHGIGLSNGTQIKGDKVPTFSYIKHSSITFQYFIFDMLGPSNSSTFGLQSFDEQGGLVYDALDYPMKILASKTLRDYVTAQHRVVYVAPHANIAYGCLGGGKSYNVFDESETWSRFLYSTGNIVYNWDIYDPNPESAIAFPAFGGYGNTTMGVIIIDTTNYPKNYLRP